MLVLRPGVAERLGGRDGDWRLPPAARDDVDGARCARGFHPWAAVAPDLEHVFLDAPSLGLTRSGDVVLTERRGDQIHHWRASVPGDPSAPLQFTGGRIS
ncbi:hypothetical protein [Lentzea sp. HUAS12]|uniref:hypothetical protein n=1 Tax=Lentzea sp. HUAS12 TaxID=2951806 RepID=UPI0020A014D1|nr:hypothetical protein [Lentzea sp. HUAS12]USX52261.1 hypothetical protein ND450_44260 [Lentzea sp. HUAS12]